jgi:glutaredoxin
MDREWIAGLVISSLIVAVFFVSCDKHTFTPSACVYCEAYRSLDSSEYVFVHDDSYCSEDYQLLENFYRAYVNTFDTTEANSTNSRFCVFCEADNNLIYHNDCDE